MHISGFHLFNTVKLGSTFPDFPYLKKERIMHFLNTSQTPCGGGGGGWGVGTIDHIPCLSAKYVMAMIKEIVSSDINIARTF